MKVIRRCFAVALALVAIGLLPFASALAQETERFTIERFDVEGNSLLDASEIERMVAPFTGPNREYGDVQRALEALEIGYRERGFSAVQVYVPEQELAGGVVKLAVVEASVRRITIEGARFFDEANIRASLPAIKEGAFPNAVRFSENVQLANENPARQVDVVLKGTDEEGLVDIDIKVADSDPLKASVTLDNTGNNQTGQHRLGLGLQHANLFNRDHVASFNYITAPEKASQIAIYSLGYRVPLYSLGHSMDFIYAKSDVDAGTTQTVAGPLAFAGKGDIYGARYNWLLARRGEFSHRFVLGLDYKAFKNNCTIAGAPVCGSSGVDSSIRPWTVTYNAQWSRPGSQTDATFSYSQNWPGASGGKGVDIAAARPSPAGGPGAPAAYNVFRGGASHFSALPGDFQYRLAISAQYTRDSLISGEQFGIAGATSVRGFSEREVARDIGYFANLELYSPNFGSELGLSESGSVRALGFYDFGFAVSNPLDGEAKQKASIASVGVGLRWTQDKNFNVRSDFAQVVDPAGGKLNRARRLQFALYFGF